MLDDRGGNQVRRLAPCVVAHEEPKQFPVANSGQRETSIALLHGRAEAEKEQAHVVERIRPDGDGRHGSEGLGDLTVWLQLEDGGPVADPHPLVERHGFHSGDERGIGWTENREVAFVIHALDGRGGFFRSPRFFQLDECVVRDELGCDKNPAALDQRAKAPSREWCFFCPGAEKVVGLVRGVDAEDRRVARCERIFSRGFWLGRYPGERRKA